MPPNVICSQHFKCLRVLEHLNYDHTQREEVPLNARLAPSIVGPCPVWQSAGVNEVISLVGVAGVVVPGDHDLLEIL